MNDIDALLSRGGLSLERLATLCRVADAGGLSKAAAGDVSRLSQYSRQLKDLEAFFGVALTRRVGRTVVLTDTARELAGRVRGQFKELACFREAEGGDMPSFGIGASHSLLEWWLWPRLEALTRALPAGSRIRTTVMRSAELVQAVEEHALDFALVRADAVVRGLRSKPLVSLSYALFVPRSLVPPKSTGKGIFAHLPLALATGGQFRALIEASAARAGVELDIRLECPSFTLAARAVASGVYAGVLPDMAAVAFRNLPVTQLALPLPGIPPRPVVLAWHPRTPESRLKSMLGAFEVAK